MKSNALLTLIKSVFVNKIHLKPWMYNVLACLLILLTYGADVLGPMLGLGAGAIAIASQFVQILLNQKPQDLIDAEKTDIISDDVAIEDYSN